MKKILVTLLFGMMFSTGLAQNVLAAPAAPTMTLSAQGLVADVSWSSVPGATGYKLYYAPYPFQGEATIGSFDMGTNTNFSAMLWPGAAFYVAIQAYDQQESSDYSNIDYFIMGPPTPEWVDDDGDGYSEYEGDCTDSNVSIHPGGTEICGDGIDQNCDGSDLACPLLRPNLSIYAPAFDFNMIKPSAYIPRGGQFTFISWAVKNSGNVNSGNFYTGLYISTDNIITRYDRLLGSRITIQNLAPGSSSEIGVLTFTMPDNIEPGTYYIGPYADTTNLVVESDESDNDSMWSQAFVY